METEHPALQLFALVGIYNIYARSVNDEGHIYIVQSIV